MNDPSASAYEFPAPSQHTVQPDVEFELSHQTAATSDMVKNPPEGADEVAPPDEYEVLQTPFLSRAHDTASTYVQEATEKGHRLHRGAATVGFVATQGLDRARIMAVVLPTTFDHILRHGAEHGWNGYETATASGLAVGGIYGAWCWAVGRTMQASMNAYPATTEEVGKNHPVFIETISSAVSGFPTEEELAENAKVSPDGGYEVAAYETRKSFLGKAALALSRGFKGGFLFGITSYAGVAKVKNYSDESQANLRRVVTAEQAVALGTVGVGVSTLVTNDYFNAAQNVRDVISNNRLLMAASGVLIGVSFVSNWVSRTLKKRQMTAQLSEVEATE